MTKDQVTELYIAMFQRAPSQDDIDYWYNSAQENGMNTIELANTMVNAAKDATHMFELEDLYPQYANYDSNNPDSIKDIISSVYSTIFNKDASQDQDGVDYWTNEVLNGKSVGEVIVAIENAAKDIAENPDKYKDSFDEDTLKQAINAEHAFKAKIKAADEIAAKISNVKPDAQSLEKMHNLIKDVKSDDDISKVMDEFDSIKDQIEEIKDDIKDNFDMKDHDKDLDYKDDVQNTNLFNNTDNSLESLNNNDLNSLFNNNSFNTYGVDSNKCQDEANKMESQIIKLSPEQFNSLNNELTQLSLNSNLQNPDPSSLKHFYQEEESIYAKYGIDAHSYNEACGVYSAIDDLDNLTHIDGYSI